jgi:hypothetical protein
MSTEKLVCLSLCVCLIFDFTLCFAEQAAINFLYRLKKQKKRKGKKSLI